MGVYMIYPHFDFFNPPHRPLFSKHLKMSNTIIANCCFKDGLQLQYLRSGIFDNASQFNEVSKIILSQLLSAFRSDDSLVIDKSLQVYLTVTDIQLSTPRFKQIGTTKPNCNKAKQLINAHFFATNQFYKNFKSGFIDLTQIDGYFNTFNCLLINLAFANFMYTERLDIVTALLKFTSIDRKYVRTFMDKNNIDDKVKFEASGLFNAVEYTSIQIKRPIVIIGKSRKNNTYHEIVYTTRNIQNYKNTIPIYLLLENNHVMFGYNFKLTKNSNFCQVCMKSVGSSNFHRCKLPMCRLCQKYYTHRNVIHTKDTCSSKVLFDTNITCPICNNDFVNTQCYLNHKELKNKRQFCLEFHKCKTCDQFIKNSKVDQHIHNTRFCLTCKKAHDINQMCYISGVHNNKTMTNNLYYFFELAMSNTCRPAFAMISQIKNGKSISSFTMEYLTDDYTGTNVQQIPRIDKGISLHTIIHYLEKVHRQYKTARNIHIFSSGKTIEYLLSNISSKQSDILFGKNGSAIGLKVGNLYFKSIQSYVNMKDHILAYLLGMNMAKVCLPLNLTHDNIQNNNFITVTKEQYDISRYIGSKLEHYEQLKYDISQIPDISDFAQTIFISLSKYKFELHLRSIVKLIELYDSIKLNLSIRTHSFVFEHRSLAQVGNFIVRSILPENEVPVISKHDDRSIKNGSRIEFCVVELLKKLHLLTCKDVTHLKSSLTNNGEQFKVKNFSADFVCTKCNFMYFVNGSYKSDCTFGHKENLNAKFFGKTKQEMRSKFNSNVKTIQILTHHKFTTIIFDECCISSRNKLAIKMHILKLLFANKIPNAKYIQTKFMHDFKKLLKNYDRSRYESISYRQCTNLAFVTFITPYFRLKETPNNKFIIERFDINSAFPNELTNIQLPCRDIGQKYVFKEADKHFDYLIASGRHSAVGFCRAKILPSINKYTSCLPFFAYRNKTSLESIFTLCRTCSILKSTASKCKHNDMQREFYVNTTIESLIFAKVHLGYAVSMSELLVYENTKKYESLTKLVETTNQIRQENPFFKCLGKSLILEGIGSFSVDFKKYTKDISVSTFASLAGHLANKKSALKNYSFYANSTADPHCILTMERNDEFKKFSSAKLNLLIYNLCSNKTRLRMYRTIMDLLDHFPATEILRTDTDSLTICFLKDKKFEIRNLLESFGFKLEKSNITGAVSFKPKSYMLLNDKNGLSDLKTCGLSLPMKRRFDDIDYKKLANTYFDKANNHLCKSRQIAHNLTNNEYFSFIKSYPYGI